MKSTETLAMSCPAPGGVVVIACMVLVAVAPAAGATPAQDPIDPLLAEAIGHYTGAIGTVDDARARDLLLEAAADGDALSTMWLARCHSRGRMLFEQDETRARELAAGVIDEVAALARQDVAEAAFLMGTAHAEGLGVEVDAELSLAWMMRAAHLGNALAQHNLGNAYRSGDGAPRAPGMAVYWYRQAAEQGDALTALWLGEMYEAGEGVERDLEQALRWYRESAGRGNARAREAVQRLGGAAG